MLNVSAIVSTSLRPRSNLFYLPILPCRVKFRGVHGLNFVCFGLGVKRGF